MSAEVNQFKTKRDMTFSKVRALMDDPEMDFCIVITHTQDGLWHVAHSTESQAVTSIETVGILEMVKQAVIDDHNRQQGP